jgi:hypothetical protein
LEGDSQHYLESSAAVTLGILDITGMSEEQAESVFETIRFADKGGEPFCVWCDCEVVYRITRKVKNRKSGEERERRIFKCKNCLKQFSVTSGTAFHGRKLSFIQIMLGTLLFVNGAAGKAALHVHRDLKCNNKTAWLLFHKLREPMTSYSTSGAPLTGEIEMDSSSVGGSVRKANRVVDRKKQPKRNMSKVTNLSVLVERGTRRVVPFLGNEAQLVQAINGLVRNPERLIVDDHRAWNPLHALFPVSRIKHAEQLSDLHGTSTNLAESYWSRFKRMYHGTYRHTGQDYVFVYHGECSWREEHNRVSNGDQFILATAAALHHPSSRRLRGYYQRTLRKAA